MDVGVLLFEKPDGTVARRMPLKLGANAIGRDASNDIALDNSSVSNFHARIVYTGGTCTIRDLKSRNGTKVNGTPLAPDVDTPLEPGDQISIGLFTIRFEREVRQPQPSGPVVDPIVRGEVPAPLPQERRRRPRITQPGARGQRSRYLSLLPPLYATRDPDGIANAILLIAEQILDPLDRGVIAQLPYYLQPATAPETMLPWLAAWVALVLDENWPLERRRELVGRAAELYRWRGTRRGLRDYIQIFTGVAPAIIEPGQEAQAPLPEGTRRVVPAAGDQPPGLAALGAADRRALDPLCFRVVVPTSATRPADLARLHQIVEAEKPAHTSYTLYVSPPATS